MRHAIARKLRKMGCLNPNLAKVGVEGSNPFARSKTIYKIKRLLPSRKEGRVGFVLGKPGGSSRTQNAEFRRLARTSVARVSEQGSKTAFPEINGIRLWGLIGEITLGFESNQGVLSRAAR